jgi:hypothetical protein
MVNGFEPNSKESCRPGCAKLGGTEKKESRRGDFYYNETEKTGLKIFRTLRFQVEL